MNRLIKYFSLESKLLMATSRNIAVELGYQEISIIHIFLADCETTSTTSIFDFAFKNQSEYADFKSKHKLDTQIDYLDFVSNIMPLNPEAKKVIRESIEERNLCKQDKVYTHHILLSCFKTTDSSLLKLFGNNPGLINNLVTYYTAKKAFEMKSLRSNFIKRFLLSFK